MTVTSELGNAGSASESPTATSSVAPPRGRQSRSAIVSVKRAMVIAAVETSRPRISNAPSNPCSAQPAKCLVQEGGRPARGIQQGQRLSLGKALDLRERVVDYRPRERRRGEMRATPRHAGRGRSLDEAEQVWRRGAD